MIMTGASLLLEIIQEINEANEKKQALRAENVEDEEVRTIDSYFMPEELESYRYFFMTDSPSQYDSEYDEGLLVCKRVKICKARGLRWSPEMQAFLEVATLEALEDSKIRRRERKAEKEAAREKKAKKAS